MPPQPDAGGRHAADVGSGATTSLVGTGAFSNSGNVSAFQRIGLARASRPAAQQWRLSCRPTRFSAAVPAGSDSAASPIRTSTRAARRTASSSSTHQSRAVRSAKPVVT